MECVEPKIERHERISSPVLSNAAKVINSAAMPVDAAQPASAPSSRFIFSISSSTLGLVKRLYILPGRSSAKSARISSASSNIKLDVRKSGDECSFCSVRSMRVLIAWVSKCFDIIFENVYSLQSGFEPRSEQHTSELQSRVDI